MYNVKASDLFRVGFCESGLTQDRDGYPVIGKDQEIGIMQFLPSTFYRFAKEMGITNPNILDRNQQIQIAAWAFSVGRGQHWTCFRNLNLLK